MIKKLLFLGVAITSLAGKAQGTLMNGLLGYYPFNGNALDESGNGKNGAVTSATLATDRFGNANSAYSFNGTTAVITTTLNTVTTGKISYCAWVKTPGSPNNGYMGMVYARSTQGLGGNGLTIYNTNNVVSDYSAGNSTINNVIYSYPNIVNNNWHYLVGTYDGSVIKLYIDGVLQQQKNLSFKLSVDANFKIGQDDIAGYARYYNGLIDDVRIYDRPLTANEVSLLYNETACGQKAGETDILVLKTITSVDNTSYVNNIKIYPNPVMDNHLTIDYNNFALLSGYKIQIVNSTGVSVFNNVITQAKSEIDLSTWSGSGMYYVRLYDAQGNTLQVRKIVLQ